jgi:uncharacterized protein (UPF0332 family)
MNDFEKCLKERRILKITSSKEMIEKEIDGAKHDLSSAEESIADEDYKWASVQAYYSIFHASKALVLKKEYREKSHYCLLIALKELYVKPGDLKPEFAEYFEMGMDIRHEADYALTYDEESSNIAVKNARKFLKKAIALLKN